VGPRPKIALVLSGGGARAAYQVGVLKAIAERLPPGAPSPFAIVCGTSAGAINASVVAAGTRDLRGAAARLEALWRSLHVRDVYRAQPLRVAGRWLASLAPSRRSLRPSSLLDSSPLAKLLARSIPFADVEAAVESGMLEALAVTAMSYRTGFSVTFCQAHPSVAMWERAQRRGVAARIGVEHLLASSAIPFLFPPAPVDGDHFGDGAVRQVAPTAPALHLGADRILVVGVGRSGVQPAPADPAAPPTMAQIGSQVLASIFTDALATDLEKVRLINAAVRQIPPAHLERSPVPLRDVGLMVIAPRVALEDLALRHAGELPPGLRLMLRGLGGHRGGTGLLSYLLFEPGYCGTLIELGYRGGQARGAEIDEFLFGSGEREVE
jgi:NTE family protein